MKRAATSSPACCLEAKYRVRRTLEDNARAAALRRVLDELRQRAQVTNTLTTNALAALEAASHEGPSAGRAEARVTIVEFSDFECPYCRSAQPLIRAVVKRWPAQVRHVFKHFPLDQHAHAMLAARAAVCAGRQDRFWPVHDRVFAAQEVSEAVIRNAASGAGLRMPEFDDCLQSEATEGHVRKDMLVGRIAGVTGTPAFFVNGQLVAPSALESAVETILGGRQ
jgi:protein-disulfide isomerase